MGSAALLDAKVPSEKDEKTGLVIHSLYGETRRPTDDMLRGVDTMVIDLQDIGARFYTYVTTMAYVLEESAKRNIAVVVLDRVNPINGVTIEGPALDKAQVSFVGYFAPMPIRHGMTLGELAKLFNAENKIGANLTVVQLRSWQRDHWFDATGIPWINPSPNMRNLIQATLYPGIGAIEGTNISVGRGTDTPFEQIGAPWIDGVKLADTLNGRNLPGIRFYPVRFTPASSKHANKECQGVFLVVTDRAALRPVRVGAEIAGALARLHGVPVRARGGGAAVRLEGEPGAPARRRRPLEPGGRMVRGGGPLAAPAGEVPDLSMMPGLKARLRFSLAHAPIARIRLFGVVSSGLLDSVPLFVPKALKIQGLQNGLALAQRSCSSSTGVRTRKQRCRGPCTRGSSYDRP